MQMTFRWYGEENDTITPQQIKQIPRVAGRVWAFLNGVWRRRRKQ